MVGVDVGGTEALEGYCGPEIFNSDQANQVHEAGVHLRGGAISLALDEVLGRLSTPSVRRFPGPTVLTACWGWPLIVSRCG